MSAASSVEHAMEALEHSRYGFRRYADSGVSHSKFGKITNSLKADGDFALEREFEGIGDKIQDNLLPHIAIDVDGFTQIRTIHHQPQTRLLGGRTKDARQLRSEASQVCGL